MIYYLIYCSSANHIFSEQELADILTVSRANNTSLNVTGILLYSNGNIAQVLEGEQAVVKNLYEKIEKDQRHRNVLLLASGEFAERSFSEWSMAFKTVKPEEWSECEGHMQLHPENLYSLIKSKNRRIGSSINTFIDINMRRG